MTKLAFYVLGISLFTTFATGCPNSVSSTTYGGAGGMGTASKSASSTKSAGPTTTAGSAGSSCPAMPAPAPGVCNVAVNPDPNVTQAQAQVALVGRWYVCKDSMGFFPSASGKVGWQFNMDGTFEELAQASAGGEISCGQGFDGQGTWKLANKCGIGQCNQYYLALSWASGKSSAIALAWANNETFARFNTGAGYDDVAKL